MRVTNQSRFRRWRSIEETAGDCSSAPLSAAPRQGQPVPIWFAALIASTCQATVDGKDHAVRWSCVAGRALYTNNGSLPERIEPFGVHLQSGQTLAVYWRPGATDYSFEVYAQTNHYCA
jgi:hypothetical protein